MAATNLDEHAPSCGELETHDAGPTRDNSSAWSKGFDVLPGMFSMELEMGFGAYVPQIEAGVPQLDLEREALVAIQAGMRTYFVIGRY